MRLTAFPTIASYVARKYASLVPNSSWNARLETPANATSLARVARGVSALRDLLDHRPDQAAALIAGHRVVVGTVRAGAQLHIQRLGPGGSGRGASVVGTALIVAPVAGRHARRMRTEYR